MQPNNIQAQPSSLEHLKYKPPEERSPANADPKTTFRNGPSFHPNHTMQHPNGHPGGFVDYQMRARPPPPRGFPERPPHPHFYQNGNAHFRPRYAPVQPANRLTMNQPPPPNIPIAMAHTRHSFNNHGEDNRSMNPNSLNFGVTRPNGGIPSQPFPNFGANSDFRFQNPNGFNNMRPLKPIQKNESHQNNYDSFNRSRPQNPSTHTFRPQLNYTHSNFDSYGSNNDGNNNRVHPPIPEESPRVDSGSTDPNSVTPEKPELNHRACFNNSQKKESPRIDPHQDHEESTHAALFGSPDQTGNLGGSAKDSFEIYEQYHDSHYYENGTQSTPNERQPQSNMNSSSYQNLPPNASKNNGKTSFLTRAAQTQFKREMTFSDPEVRKYGDTYARKFPR